MKVLIATEGSKFSDAAIEKCCKLFEEAMDTEIRVLTVVEPNLLASQAIGAVPTLLSEIEGSSRAVAEETAEAANSRILEKIPSIGGGLTSRVAVGFPSEVIVDEAKRWGADLIIVGSHGYGLLDRALLGSVSNAVVHHAPCSVMVVREPVAHNGNGH